MTDYVVDQTKKLHLYLIRIDLTGFQHLHPALGGSGTWSVPVTISNPGDYRVVADFTADTSAGPALHILGAPLKAPGNWSKESTPPVTAVATVDGYAVNVAGRLRAGVESPLIMRITRGGEPVTNLQPYLGVWSHLSAFRAGDLAFLHLHPTQQPMTGMSMDSPQLLAFKADVRSAGTYEVFVQFQTGGRLHTAALTLKAQ